MTRRYAWALKFADGHEAIVIVQGNTRNAALKRAYRHVTKEHGALRAFLFLGPARTDDKVTPFPGVA